MPPLIPPATPTTLAAVPHPTPKISPGCLYRFDMVNRYAVGAARGGQHASIAQPRPGRRCYSRRSFALVIAAASAGGRGDCARCAPPPAAPLSVTLRPQVEVPPHDLAFSQIMQMFDIKGGSKVRGGFSLSRVVSCTASCHAAFNTVTPPAAGSRRERGAEEQVRFPSLTVFL